MNWEHQGRQQHMWFGHGTAAEKAGSAAPDASMAAQTIDERAAFLAYGAIAALPASLRGPVETQYHEGGLPRVKQAMTA